MGNKIKKINYQFYNEENDYKQLALLLFDMIDIKQNIAINFFRISNSADLFEFKKVIQCKIVYDIKRRDIYCIYIPEIKSNLEFNSIMKNNYIFPTECTYMQLTTDFDNFLYNKEYIENNNEMLAELTAFKAVLDHEGIHLYFNLDYFDIIKINFILENWEKKLQGIKFNKYC